LIFFQKFLTSLIKMPNRQLLFLSFLFIAICSSIAFLLEPETFTSPFNALWWTMTTLSTVGYGDFFPKTVLGKLLGIFLMIFGVGLMGVVIGRIFDFLGSYKKNKEEGRLKYKRENHIILINWSVKAEICVKDLLNRGENLNVVLIDNQLDKSPMEHERIHFIKGDPAETETHMNANTPKAKSVIIFSRDGSQETDGSALLISNVIETIAEKVHTVVEIKKQKHFASFRTPIDEPISSDETSARILLRSAIYPGISKLYNELLTKGGDDLYMINKCSEWETYKDAFMGLLECGATLIAEGNHLDINRRLHEKIPEDAHLFVICDKETYMKIQTKNVLTPK
jgi:voltage-gated potassium channel